MSDIPSQSAQETAESPTAPAESKVDVPAPDSNASGGIRSRNDRGLGGDGSNLTGSPGYSGAPRGETPRGSSTPSSSGFELDSRDASLRGRGSTSVTLEATERAGSVSLSASNRADFPGCSLCCSKCESCDDECGCVPGPCWWCGHSVRSGADSKIADIPGALREEAKP